MKKIKLKYNKEKKASFEEFLNTVHTNLILGSDKKLTREQQRIKRAFSTVFDYLESNGMIEYIDKKED